MFPSGSDSAVRALVGTDLGWVPQWLSPPRWSTYSHLAGGDPATALACYEWNIDIGRALMHDVAHVEVALRNRYDAILTQELDSSTHWVFEEETPLTAPLLRRRDDEFVDLNALNRASLAQARRRSRKRTRHPTPGQVVAELNFGFWRHMTDAAHEKTLWIPILHNAYPARSDRREIDRMIGLINMVRNRAAHHEPLVTPNRLPEAHEAGRCILELAEMIMPELAEHIRSTSTLDAALDANPMD